MEGPGCLRPCEGELPGGKSDGVGILVSLSGRSSGSCVSLTIHLPLMYTLTRLNLLWPPTASGPLPSCGLGEGLEGIPERDSPVM